TIRKDQFGAIEDAQKAQMSNEAGMSKGATAGSIAIATGCVAATALGQPEIAIPCVIGGALYTGAVKLSHRARALLGAAADEIADHEAEPECEDQRGGEIVLHELLGLSCRL